MILINAANSFGVAKYIFPKKLISVLMHSCKIEGFFLLLGVSKVPFCVYDLIFVSLCYYIVIMLFEDDF